MVLLNRKIYFQQEGEEEEEEEGSSKFQIRFNSIKVEMVMYWTMGWEEAEPRKLETTK